MTHTLTEDELETIEIIARNGQTGRLTRYEVLELVRAYRLILESIKVVRNEREQAASAANTS